MDRLELAQKEAELLEAIASGVEARAAERPHRAVGPDGRAPSGQAQGSGQSRCGNAVAVRTHHYGPKWNAASRVPCLIETNTYSV